MKHVSDPGGECKPLRPISELLDDLERFAAWKAILQDRINDALERARTDLTEAEVKQLQADVSEFTEECVCYRERGGK